VTGVRDLDRVLKDLRKQDKKLLDAQEELLEVGASYGAAQVDELQQRILQEINQAQERARTALLQLVAFPPGHIRHQVHLDAFWKVCDYDRSVFVMTKFPGASGVGKDAELQQVIDTVADAVRASGFVPRIASARDYHGLLWDNVELYLLGCSRGVVILEDRYLPELNPNVAMEWGWMRAATKPILVLAEEKFDKNRADFTGLIQYTFDWANPKPGISDAVTKFLSP